MRAMRPSLNASLRPYLRFRVGVSVALGRRLRLWISFGPSVAAYLRCAGRFLRGCIQRLRPKRQESNRGRPYR